MIFKILRDTFVFTAKNFMRLLPTYHIGKMIPGVASVTCSPHKPQLAWWLWRWLKIKKRGRSGCKLSSTIKWQMMVVRTIVKDGFCGFDDQIDQAVIRVTSQSSLCFYCWILIRRNSPNAKRIIRRNIHQPYCCLLLLEFKKSISRKS